MGYNTIKEAFDAFKLIFYEYSSPGIQFILKRENGRVFFGFISNLGPEGYENNEGIEIINNIIRELANIKIKLIINQINTTVHLNNKIKALSERIGKVELKGNGK